MTHLSYLNMTRTFNSCMKISIVVEKISLVMFPHKRRQIKHVEWKLSKKNLVVHTIDLIFLSKSGEY